MIRTTSAVIEILERDPDERLIRTHLEGRIEWRLLHDLREVTDQTVDDLRRSLTIAPMDDALPLSKGGVAQTWAMCLVNPDTIGPLPLPGRPGPGRVRRRRGKGCRLPTGTVYIGRPGRFGNPFLVDDPEEAVELYRRWIKGRMSLAEFQSRSGQCRCRGYLDREEIIAGIPGLRGLNLACWCPLGLPNGRRHPCHGDFLLEEANA